jgi:hypothetical protein
VKKQPSRRRSNFPGKFLFLDDIEDAIGILSEYGDEVNVSDDEYEVNSLKEFIDKREKSPRAQPGPSLHIA